MDVVVTGIGLKSCLGSLNQSWNSILEGRSGISRQQPFIELSSYPLGLINQKPNELFSLTKEIVQAAIADAHLELPLTKCGVAIGSSRGCQNIWEESIASNFSKLSSLREHSFADYKFRRFRPLPISPSHLNWLNTLPHQSAVTTAKLIKTSAPVLSPMAACATGIHAIFRGYELIQTGECQRVVAGAIETPITPLSLAGFARMGALAETGCYPFDRYREGLVLGEGGAVFVLETAELARSRGAKIYGKILGFGLACDASSTTAPMGNSSAIAVKNCLARSNLAPQDIDYIHAHGTSTRLNDRHEAKLIQHLFSHSVAVSSTKGATGHTLGASGAIGTAFCLMALRYGYLPPCVGLHELDLDFNHLNVVREARRKAIANTLCFSFGFGGQNAILAIGR